jgi:glycosyltransferase involved in cell wall biosynthesis
VTPEIRPLHIVHTESSCGWGGQEIRILTEAQGMLARGHRVQLLCPAEAPICEAARRRGILVEALPIARKNLRGLGALRRWLRAHRDVDVINTHSSTDSWLVALARLTLHRCAPMVRTRHVSTRIRNDWPTRWLYQSATRHIVTTGEALREQLARDNGFDAARITSVPTGIDLERFRPCDAAGARRALGLDPARHYLGILATLRTWKGHVYLLDAFARLALQYPDWQLLLVGDGPQWRNLNRRIDELGLRERVIMPGNREDVPLWLNSMDVFVLPSYGEEGVSQSVMQAMACARPVVSTTVGAIHEAVAHGETGLLVAPHDVTQLQEAVERLMRDGALRERLGAAGRARAERLFGTGRMLDAMESVFRNALAESR